MSRDTASALRSETGRANALTTHVRFAKWHWRITNVTKLRARTLAPNFSTSDVRL